ncbi:MAG: NAD-dependent deacylase [Bacillota bacterium]|nr:NAD-dependent deacylase [Bacillota bacterium]
MTELNEKIRKVAELLLDSDYALALTGAGISTESGIPDFRSPGSGLWTMLDPEMFTIQGFKRNPGAFYRAGIPFFKMLEQAEPNEAHQVLAELENRGMIKGIITQNVDALHQKGGSKKVYEIHGTLSSASCMHCGRQVPIEEVAADVEEGLIPPLCVECGEVLKPDVVLFGEPLSPDYGKAMKEVEKADLILVIGSSMQVSPANQIPALCDNVVIINRTPTFHDSKARVVINDSVVTAMRLLLKEL